MTTTAVSSRRGRSIRLFLADGSPTGLIIAEIVNWTGKVIVVPRGSLAAFLQRQEAQSAGVYILAGQDPDDPFRSRVYVGESETVGKRLREHDSDERKAFFERAIVFVSKDENVTKAHARHLEEQLTQRIIDAGRTKPMHRHEPGGAALPEADRSDMDFFLDQIEIVLPVLGLDILRPIAPTPIRSPEATSANPPHAAAATITTPPEFVFKIGSSTDAKGVEVNNEFIVKAGSIGRDVETESLPKAYRAIRDQLKADKSLEIENGQLVFKRDIAFTSPTAAACVVYGASISGPANWHVDDTNETYADYRTRSLGAAEAGAGAGNGG